MNEYVPGDQCAASESNHEPQRRRSARLTSPQQQQNNNVVGVVGDKMAPAAAVKRSIVVRKIQPRKTAVVLAPETEERNDESEQQRRSGGSRSSQAINVGVVDKMAPSPSGGAARAVKRSIVVRKIQPRKTTALPAVASVEEQHDDEEEEQQQRLSEGSILRRRPKPSISSIPDPAGPAPGASLRSPRPSSDKPSIVVKKITPRRTAAFKEHNKENEEQRLSEGCPLQKNPKISTPDSAGLGRKGPVRREHSLKKPAFPSPILASPPRASAAPPQPTGDVRDDPVWSQKVRRSYSRLSGESFHNSPPCSRENLFGFDNLRTPEVIRKPNKTLLDISKSVSGVNSFTSLMEAEDCSQSTLAPDLDIPGVAVVKEKRRRNKVQKIDLKQVDELAAKMNAEFEEAEGFDLCIE